MAPAGLLARRLAGLLARRPAGNRPTSRLRRAAEMTRGQEGESAGGRRERLHGLLGLARPSMSVTQDRMFLGLPSLSESIRWAGRTRTRMAVGEVRLHPPHHVVVYVPLRHRPAPRPASLPPGPGPASRERVDALQQPGPAAAAAAPRRQAAVEQLQPLRHRLPRMHARLVCVAGGPRDPHRWNLPRLLTAFSHAPLRRTATVPEGPTAPLRRRARAAGHDSDYGARGGGP
jgi:hypothetical protein